VYDALVGERLTPQTIEDACRFLTGACQCTVKAQNPGIDLLMSVAWDDLILPMGIADDTPPTLVGLDDFAPAESQPATDRAAGAGIAIGTPAVASHTPPPSNVPRADLPLLDTALPAPAAQSSPSTVPLGRSTLIVLGALFVAVTMGTLFVMFRSQ
jgi:hypothetical protein